MKFLVQVIVFLFIVSGVLLPAIGGPIWGWLVAIVLGVVVTPFALLYPCDRATRFAWAGVGGFLAFAGTFGLVFHRPTWYEVHSTIGTLMIGLGMILSAVLTKMNAGDREQN